MAAKARSELCGLSTHSRKPESIRSSFRRGAGQASTWCCCMHVHCNAPPGVRLRAPTRNARGFGDPPGGGRRMARTTGLCDRRHRQVEPALAPESDHPLRATVMTPPRRHAIVLGASMAGLGAARALVDHFERVTLVERDELSTGTANRKGVPQAQHAHGLLPSGYRVLHDYFP